MSNRRKIKSKGKVKRQGSKALRAPRLKRTPARKDRQAGIVDEYADMFSHGRPIL